MKSSTLYRSNLSKEKIQQLEGFKARAEHQANISYEENTPNVYVRPKAEKELDTLLGSFNISTAKEKTPAVYLISGFMVGAVCMFMMTAFVSFSAKESVVDETYTVPPVQKESKGFFNFTKKAKKSSITILPADTAATPAAAPAPKTETYTVKSGDTLEAIVIRFYGKNIPEKVNEIVAANKMSSPNALQIGQKLIIPMN